MLEASSANGRLRADVSGRTECNVDYQPLVSFVWRPEAPGRTWFA
jgi:hypothetical protein